MFYTLCVCVSVCYAMGHAAWNKSYDDDDDDEKEIIFDSLENVCKYARRSIACILLCVGFLHQELIIFVSAYIRINVFGCK